MENAPNLNPSPKSRFLQSGTRISEHRTMVQTSVFERSLDYALLEYQSLVAVQVSENPSNAAFAGLKLTGAQEFVQTLKLLSEQPRLAGRPLVQNLDHKL